jgi:hypothetical protein
MDETRYDLTAHQPTENPSAERTRTSTSRRGLVALTVVIGLLALVGGAVVGASIGGSGNDSAPEEVAAVAETTTTSTTEDIDGGEHAEPEPEPTPTTQPEPTPTTDPEPDPEGDPDDEGGTTLIPVDPGLFLPKLTFDEVIDMGTGNSAEWTLTNNGVGDVSWYLETAVGFSYSSPDATEDWLVVPSGVLSPGESTTIIIGLAEPQVGVWSKNLTLTHGGFQTDVTVTGMKPVQIVPGP